MDAMEPKTVLLVDDSPSARVVAKAYLERDGFRVVESDGWASVGPLVTKHSPDVAVVDLNMPGLDGEVLIDLMRRYWPLLPVLVFTSEDERRANALRARGIRVLAKSSAALIADAVRSLLDAR